jgi:predicted PurR-regulated permease PerM
VQNDAGSSEDRDFVRRALDASVRIGIVALLAFYCLQIATPFVQPVVWAVIIAIGLRSSHQRLARLLGGREKLSAALLVAVGLAILIGPTVALTVSLVETAQALAKDLHQGGLSVPPPPKSVASWPVVGDGLFAFWSETSQNLEAALRRVAPQLKTIGLWLVSGVASTGVGIVKFALSIVLAGVLLVQAKTAGSLALAIAGRLAGARGPALAELSRATVQSVTRGILGVAVIQALLAGIGMLAAGVPAAGLWALLVLLVAVIQLPALLVLGPAIAWVFSTSSTAVAIAFAVWSLLVGLSDNVLKPMLMGRGVDAPMLVIFVGAIGGFIHDGIVGLFVGAVVLALGYRLLMAWLEEPTPA